MFTLLATVNYGDGSTKGLAAHVGVAAASGYGFGVVYTWVRLRLASRHS